VSQHHLTKVVQVLAHAGLVQTLRGKGGGLFLGREPETIHLGDVVRICEGDRPVLECLEPGPVRCRIAPACRLVGLIDDAFEAFYAELNRHTLADLVQPPRATALARILMLDT
jgi:Rrf2 family nitric oxide-sensitive transcriptional repressor